MLHENFDGKIDTLIENAASDLGIQNTTGLTGAFTKEFGEKVGLTVVGDHLGLSQVTAITGYIAGKGAGTYKGSDAIGKPEFQSPTTLIFANQHDLAKTLNTLHKSQDQLISLDGLSGGKGV